MTPWGWVLLVIAAQFVVIAGWHGLVTRHKDPR